MSHVYGCHNHPERVNDWPELTVQDGWTPDGKRATRQHKTEWAPIECGHDFSATDPACTGCRWRGSL